MAVQAAAADRGEGARRYLLPIGAVIGLVIIAIGTVFLADPKGAANLLAGIYDVLGNKVGATALRNGQGDTFLAKLILAGVALVVGVGGIWMVFSGASAIVGLLKPKLAARIIPWVFILPALTLLGIYLVYSTGVTIWESIVGGKGFSDNYSQILKPDFLAVLRNNVLWLVLGTGGSVGIGLVIAAMFDRVRREALAKTFVFLPLAISLVGASVIWKFVYEWRPASQPQYGLLNAVWTSFGGQPINWVATPPINTYLLILIMVWLQTGFAMVVLSAAIKGVSTEVIEAARMDGAGERQLFFRIVVPIIKGSIITVATTIAIAILKVFDIIFVMTGGRYDTDVVANRMFLEKFQLNQESYAAALAVVLFVGVLPIMFINLRNLRQQGVGK